MTDLEHEEWLRDREARKNPPIRGPIVGSRIPDRTDGADEERKADGASGESEEEEDDDDDEDDAPEESDESDSEPAAR